MSRLRNNIRLGDAIARYIERITAEGQSEKSCYTAEHALKRFHRAVATPREPNPYVHLLSDEDLDRYFYGENGVRRGVQAVTFNRYRSVLKVFYDYCLLMRWTDTSPMDGIQRARSDAPKSRLMLNAGELLSLLDHCNPTLPVERIACSLGMNTGLRGNDIRHLTLFDASLASGVIQTEIRKTRKLDVKPITMELHWELAKWLNTYAELMGIARDELPSEWLLVPSFQYRPTKDGKRHLKLCPTRIHQAPWSMVQRPLARMGYPSKGEGFHTLRRSSARALFESLRTTGEGRDHALMIVKAFLNHANTAQTEHYLGLNNERDYRDALMKDKPFLSALAEQEQLRVASGGVGG
jgi:integrase